MTKPDKYGDDWADVYDDYVRKKGEALNPLPIVNYLRKLNRKGPILELGIGTGRVAIPLAQNGIKVVGIEASKKMIDILKEKTKSNNIEIIQGDFSNFKLSNKFSSAILLYNGIIMLNSRADQENCFYCVNKSLKRNGLFIVETQILFEDDFKDGFRFDFIEKTNDSLEFRVSYSFDKIKSLHSKHFWINKNGDLKIRSVSFCNISLKSLDLIAKKNGFILSKRFSNWWENKLDKNSSSQISVYKKIGKPQKNHF